MIQENLYIFFNMLVEKFFILASSENSVMLNTEFIITQIKNKQDIKNEIQFLYIIQFHYFNDSSTL